MNNKFLRVPKISAIEIKKIRKKYKLTQRELGELLNVSPRTVEAWEAERTQADGPVAKLLWLLNENPNLLQKLIIPSKGENIIRLYYMLGERICTLIDIDEKKQLISIVNYTNNVLDRAFGNNLNPDYEDYKNFLKERCFPEGRDMLKVELRKLDIPFYDPFLIIEKTEGRVYGDEFWIKVER